MLEIKPDACSFEPDRSRGTVVIESDLTGPPFNAAFDELTGNGTVQMAQQFATQMGCAPAYLNGNKIGPYPVNAEGLPLEEVKGQDGKPLPQTHPRMQPAKYRVDVPIARSIR